MSNRSIVILIGVILAAVSGWLILPRLGTAQNDATSDSSVAPRIVAVERADLRSVLVLSGVVASDANLDVMAGARAVVASVAVVPGQLVAKGEALAVLRTPDGGLSSLVAPLPGTVVRVSATAQQAVEAAGILFTLRPDRFQIVATVDPSLLYRLYDPPIQISAKVDRGPAPFECTFLSLGTEGSAGPSGPVELRCRVPAEQRVFPGVRVKLAVVTGEATGALVVPLTAVEGEADRGFVTVAAADGSRQRREVRLGLTDGSRIVVVSGLSLGEQILDLPPSLFPELEGGGPRGSASPQRP